jgi:protein TonB
MNNRFVLPAAVALSAHAFLLFGFKKSPPVARQIEKPVSTRELPFHMLPDDPPPDEKAESGRPSATTSRPEMPENLIKQEIGVFTQPPQPTGPAPIKNIVSIDDRPKGLPGTGGFGPGGPGSGVVMAGLLDNTPHARVQTPPIYPASAKKDGRTGEVVVSFVVDERGEVHSARVVSSSDSIFEEPTLRAVSKWRFSTGFKNGAPVSFRMVVPVAFNLAD